MILEKQVVKSVLLGLCCFAVAGQSVVAAEKADAKAPPKVEKKVETKAEKKTVKNEDKKVDTKAAAKSEKMPEKKVASKVDKKTEAKAVTKPVLTPELTSKVIEGQKNLALWVKKAEIIKAVEQANSAKSKFDNAKWKGLAKTDPKVMAYINSEAGKLLSSLQKGSLGKLFIRDAKGNFVAGSKKPAIYNINDRMAFTSAIRGKSWNSTKTKSDPTTKQESIQISTPIMSKGKVIGIIHANVVVK